MIPDLNSYLYDRTYTLPDLSPQKKSIICVGFDANKLNSENTVGNKMLVPFLRGDFTALVRKGLRTYIDATKNVTGMDNLSLGDYTKSFSIRLWTRPDTATETNSKVIMNINGNVYCRIVRGGNNLGLQGNRIYHVLLNGYTATDQKLSCKL